MRKLKLKNHFLVIIGSLLGSYLYLIPFFYDKKLRTGSLLEIDLRFHLSRLYGIGHAFSNPINYISFKGVGHGVNYFYPWLTFYPAYIFYKLFNDGVLAFMLFLFLLTFLTFTVSYYCYKIAFKNGKAALIFSILYTFSGYRAVDIFQRGDVGELIAIVFFPIVLLSFYKLVVKYNFAYWPLLSISFSLIVYSHILSAVFFAFTLLLLFLGLWINVDCKKVLLVKIAECILLTMGLTSFYWLPMIQQMHFITITSPSIHNLGDTALDLSWLFTNSISNTINAGGTILGLVLLIMFFISSTKLKSEGYVFNIVWVTSALLILLSTKLFPWYLIQNTPLQVIQFPWRFLEIATLLISAVGAWVLKDIKVRNIVFILLLSLSINTSISFNMTKVPSPFVEKNNFMQSVIEKESLDYYPILSSNQNKDSINNKEFLIHEKTKKVNFSANDTSVIIPVHANIAGKDLNTPFLRYLGVHAKIDGKETKVKTSSRGTVLVYVPKNSKKIVVTSKYTKLGSISKVVSMLSLLIVIFFYLKILFSRHSKNNKRN